MNRRDFLKRLGGAAAAVSLSPLLDLAEILPTPVPAAFVGPIYFKGIPLVYDQFCPTRTVYLHASGVWMTSDGVWKKISRAVEEEP